jgi:hypothetical protein
LWTWREMGCQELGKELGEHQRPPTEGRCTVEEWDLQTLL